MIARPTILRARVCRELACRHPKGMTAGQVLQYIAPSLNAWEVRDVLDGLVEDGLAVRALEPRPHPREPLHVLVAARRLMGMAASGSPQVFFREVAR